MLSQHPDWTERELVEVITLARDNAVYHPTFMDALAEPDPHTRQQLIEADPDALDAALSAAFAPMLLEVAREQ